MSEISDDVIINAYYQPEGEEYPVEAYPMVQNTDDTLTATLSVGTLTAPEKPIRFIVAAYDQYGRMLSSTLVESGEGFVPKVEASIDIPVNVTNLKFKAFVLDTVTKEPLRTTAWIS